MTLYLDASALLRILFREPGIRAPLGRGTIAASSRVSEVEAFRAIDRARLGGHLDDADGAHMCKELHGLFARLHLLPIGEEVLALARATFPVNVRALDALHVATAEVLRAQVGPLEFWTHDARQAIAALTRGLEVRGVRGGRAPR